jgi:hypothetical protein
MPKKTVAGEAVGTSLAGYYLWAFERFRDRNGIDTPEALRLIVVSWLRREDPEFLARLGISEELFSKAAGKNVVSIDEKKASGAKKTEP